MTNIATAYTGANVSLEIGGHPLIECFGVTWETSDSKRPIYGYNSKHFDAVAKGQTIVMGQILLNYVRPNTLSYYLQNYYSDKVKARNTNTGIEEALSRIHNAIDITNNIVVSDRIRAVQRENLLLNLFNSNGTTERLTESIDVSNFLLRQNLSFWDNEHRITALEMSESEGLENPLMSFERPEVLRNRLNINQKQELTPDQKRQEFGGLPLSYSKRRNPAAVHSRPSQFGDNDGLSDPLDIIIKYGNFDNEGSDYAIDYQESSAIILRNVHFVGSSQSIMSDDQPLLEVHKFIARKEDKHL